MQENEPEIRFSPTKIPGFIKDICSEEVVPGGEFEEPKCFLTVDCPEVVYVKVLVEGKKIKYEVTFWYRIDREDPTIFTKPKKYFSTKSAIIDGVIDLKNSCIEIKEAYNDIGIDINTQKDCFKELNTIIKKEGIYPWSYDLKIDSDNASFAIEYEDNCDFVHPKDGEIGFEGNIHSYSELLLVSNTFSKILPIMKKYGLIFEKMGNPQEINKLKTPSSQEIA